MLLAHLLFWLLTEILLQFSAQQAGRTGGFGDGATAQAQYAPVVNGGTAVIAHGSGAGGSALAGGSSAPVRQISHFEKLFRV